MRFFEDVYDLVIKNPSPSAYPCANSPNCSNVIYGLAYDEYAYCASCREDRKHARNRTENRKKLISKYRGYMRGRK